MKGKSLSAFLLVLVIITIPALLCAITAKVITKENFIREDAKFYSPVKLKVQFEDDVEILSESGDWLKVRFGGVEGFIHKNAVRQQTPLRPVLLGSEIDPAESDDEVSLASKGFNPQVEASYRERNPDLNFDGVDHVEGYGVKNDTIYKFAEEGGLRFP